jgi:SAM-dependent methyltransferase
MQGYDRSTYGERFADVYDEWYDGITDAETCAELIEALADEADGDGVLELGVGTGRLAVPMARRGLEVVGVDASTAMLEALEAKAEAAGVAVASVLGDMADPPVGTRRFAVVLVAYNTLFNLVDPADQARCIRAAAARLAPGGSFVVEAFVPSADAPRGTVEPRTITADRVVLSVSRSEPDRQEALGQYVDITEAGISLRPWHIRWSTPAQLDEMAAVAGLVVGDRWSDWARTPFGADDAVHVTRYVAGPTAPASS